MDNINSMLSEALAPYETVLGPAGPSGERVVTLRNAAGAIVVERMFAAVQMTDIRQLTDLVDGLHRDLKIAEGRLQPCVLAALRNASQTHRPVVASFMH